jgi:hypothetical protein
MSLPLDLQKLPSQALDVIRFLDDKPDGVSIKTIRTGTGLSKRVLGKVIRRLVTRYYLEMPQRDIYCLTGSGQQAAAALRHYDDDDLLHTAAAAPDVDADVARHERLLTVVLPQELIAQGQAGLHIGFNAPESGQPPLPEAARIILRVSAPGCNVAPVERPLEVPGDAPAGPVPFRVQPRQTGNAQVKIEVLQLVTLDALVPVGTVYFNVPVSGFPTPLSAEKQALGTRVGLLAG